jgi:hypothetical protein
MIICLGIIVYFAGSLFIFSLCKAAGRADKLEEEIMKREKNI